MPNKIFVSLSIHITFILIYALWSTKSTTVAHRLKTTTPVCCFKTTMASQYNWIIKFIGYLTPSSKAGNFLRLKTMQIFLSVCV